MPKPTTGDTKQGGEDLLTCVMSTPLRPEWPCMSWLATPTPMMEPIMVCELEAGRPRHQVARFQRMAAMRRAKTMAKPEPELTLRMSSTGSRLTME